MAVISGSGAVKAKAAVVQLKPKAKDTRVALVAAPASVSGDAAVRDKSNGQDSAGD